MKRKRLSKRKNKRDFRRKQRFNTRNIAPEPSRGGIRA